ncbi:metallophosphoesterase [Magnetococcales bacterium HHB-1]
MTMKKRGLLGWKVKTRLMILAMLGWVLFVEPYALAVREFDIPLFGLKQSTLRVALLSDLHAEWQPLSRFEQIVAQVNAWQPDFVFLLGDYVGWGLLNLDEDDFTRMKEVAQILGRLKANIAVISVLGNHDVWLSPKRVRQALEGEGITVLEQEKISFSLGNSEKLTVVGMPHFFVDIPKPDRFIDEASFDEALILLTHDPEALTRINRKRPLIAFAGHTHDCQVRIPGMASCPASVSRAPDAWMHGLIHWNQMNFYITSGIGVSVIPVRWNSTPEIVFAHLHPPA